MRASPSAGIGLQSAIQEGLHFGLADQNLLERPISRHPIFEATYSSDECFALL